MSQAVLLRHSRHSAVPAASPPCLLAPSAARQPAASRCLNCSSSWSSSACWPGYVGPKFFGQIGKSEVKADASAQIDALQKSLDQYRLDVGRYPSTEQGLAVLVTKPADEPKWAGPLPFQGRAQGSLGATTTSTARRANTASTTCCRSARTAAPAARVRMPTSPPGDPLRAAVFQTRVLRAGAVSSERVEAPDRAAVAAVLGVPPQHVLEAQRESSST